MKMKYEILPTLPNRYKKKDVFSPGIEPGTFCVLDRCDNHYTTETYMIIEK